MMKRIGKWTIGFFGWAALTQAALGQCVVVDSSAPNGGGVLRGNGDVLARLLADEDSCPRNAMEFRTLLKGKGLSLAPSMVANRGFHNPAFGSFSFFETVKGEVAGLETSVGEGEFYFGHFTGPVQDGVLGLDQNPASDDQALMIELIVWDPTKGYYNFYELRGTASSRTWLYQGDSRDILADLEVLHRERRSGKPAFGQRLRCSGCHLAGGPIMKELASPHNDWWTTERKLDLGTWRRDGEIKAIMSDLVDASEFAAAVKAGMKKLNESPTFRALKDEKSLQERLRPLFCPVEVNLASDQASLAAANATITVPSGFFVDERLAKAELKLAKPLYQGGLELWQSRFPETGALDADHAWLAPVKAASDVAAVDELVREGLIDEEFVADVLAVDRATPVVSERRCGLLKLLPNEARLEWKELFIELLGASNEPGAQELHENLTNPERTAEFHRKEAGQFLAECQARLGEPVGLAKLVGYLAEARADVFASEISTADQGQILEPGFRVIFPRVTPDPAPGAHHLNAACEPVRW